MAKYCGKCGTEIKENTKFCPKCGAAVGAVKTAEQKKSQQSVAKSVEQKKSQQSVGKPSEQKAGTPVSWGGPSKKLIGIVAAVAVVAIIAITVVFSKSSGSNYEKPLKDQVAGIEKCDENKYVESFTDKGKEHFLEDNSKEFFERNAKEVKDISYEVKEVRDGDISDVWDTIEIRYYNMSDTEKKSWYNSIEEVKVVKAEITYMRDDDEEPYTYEADYRMLKVGGKWCTVDSIF